jgi:hypothetical protein
LFLGIFVDKMEASGLPWEIFVGARHAVWYHEIRYNMYHDIGYSIWL